MSLRIKTGDTVEVITGSARYNPKSKKRGKVRRVYPDDNKVLIENINMRYKHLRPSNMDPKGGRIEKELPIDISNVMLICPSCDETTRIKTRTNDGGKKVRYCMRCDKDIDTDNAGT